jgi:hypothetical protein
MKNPKFVAAMLAVIPVTQAYLTEGKTVNMSSTYLTLYGSNAIDNDFYS